MMMKWPSHPVHPISEAELWSFLAGQDERWLLQRFIVGDLPAHPGMSKEQCVNLLRHVLREKMGNDRFYAEKSLGSREGAKVMGNAFETVVEGYLSNNLGRQYFMTEKQIKEEGVPQTTATTGVVVTPHVHHNYFQRTGEITSTGKPVFAGPCEGCDKICKIPFSPTPLPQRLTPVLCLPCRVPSLVLTPDFLFKNAININGVRVHWMDCKCFFGSSMHRGSVESIQSQASKYTARWGPGAIVFSYGFSAGLRIEGAILLDASPVDLSPLYQAQAILWSGSPFFRRGHSLSTVGGQQLAFTPPSPSSMMGYYSGPCYHW